jgi:hypothetical protein
MAIKEKIKDPFASEWAVKFELSKKLCADVCRHYHEYNFPQQYKGERITKKY